MGIVKIILICLDMVFAIVLLLAMLATNTRGTRVTASIMSLLFAFNAITLIFAG